MSFKIMAILLIFFKYLISLFCIIRFVYGKATEPVIVSVFAYDDSAQTGPQGGVIVTSMDVSRIRLVGYNLASAQNVLLTTSKTSCSFVNSTKPFTVSGWDEQSHSAFSEVTVSRDIIGSEYLYICLKWGGTNESSNPSIWKHQGAVTWLSVQVLELEAGSLLPLWLQISIITVLLVLSGLFSGLNLGLMSLDQTELAIIQKVGSPLEKKYAKRISPLRNKGNFLLCTLLLGNVMVNSTFTILFDNLTNGLIAIISSTFGIVVFGEIIPQAICSRHGLAVGARTFWLTKFFMVVTFPLSYPVSLILDKILGEEMGQVFNKEKLQELIRMTADQQVLHDNEANIISGALQLTNKSVDDVMTKIEDVYMLDINTELNFETLTEIMRHGYTRIPVYDGVIKNIVNLLNIKDLALLDPDDKTHLSTVCKFYDHKPLFVDNDLRLDTMLQEFLQGNSHMAIVQRLHNTDDTDPYFENTGVVTLEDVIEEILQSEIIDETDRMTDNRQKKPLTQLKDYSMFPSDPIKSKLSKQLEFVAFQFLVSNVEAFSEKYLNRNVLKNLMKKNIVVNLTPTNPVSPKNFIFQKGVASDKFVLILQGMVEVTIGTENMIFESGPFSNFGSECFSSVKRVSTPDLKGKDYVPDFAVRALTPVQYLCIQRSHYMAAIRTTRMLRSHVFSGDESNVNDHFDMEYAKLALSEKNMSSNKNISSLVKKSSNSVMSLRSSSKGSTSSLNRLHSLSDKDEFPINPTGMRRSGSDAKYISVDLDRDLNQSSRKHTGDSISNESVEGAKRLSAAEDKPPSYGVSKELMSQTSFPFAPHFDQKEEEIRNDAPSVVGHVRDTLPAVTKPPAIDSLSTSVNDSKSVASNSFTEPRDTFPDAIPDHQSGFGSMSAMTMEQLEKVPLVGVTSTKQLADSDSHKVFSKSVDDFSDSEKGTLMQDHKKDHQSNS